MAINQRIEEIIILVTMKRLHELAAKGMVEMGCVQIGDDGREVADWLDARGLKLTGEEYERGVALVQAMCDIQGEMAKNGGGDE